MGRALFVFSLLVLAAGCRAPEPRGELVDWENPQEAQTRTTITYDDPEKGTVFNGPCVERYHVIRLYIEACILLRAWQKEASDSLTYQLYYRYHYYDDHWHSYNSVYDLSEFIQDEETVFARQPSSERMKLTVLGKREIGRHLVNNEYEERVGIDISRSYLEKAKTEGILMALLGWADRRTIGLPGAYVTGFLNAVDAHMAQAARPQGR